MLFLVFFEQVLLHVTGSISAFIFDSATDHLGAHDCALCRGLGFATLDLSSLLKLSSVAICCALAECDAGL